VLGRDEIDYVVHRLPRYGPPYQASALLMGIVLRV
jgi:hypothetical protein